MSYFITIGALLLSLFQILSPLFAIVSHGGEDNFFDDWSSEQIYDEDYAVNIEKDPSRDFVILNLTDVQLEKWEAYAENGKMATALINKLVEDYQPDLITLTGDNAWSTSTYLKLIKDVDKFGIPWAPIMGNHDGSCCISEFWCAYEMYDADNCVWRFGPKGMGYGNYIINITENGNIIHTLFMMDTHSSIEEDNINGAADSGYDGLWANQLEWYSWAVDGISALAGHTVESTVFIHIPLVQYKTAWLEAWDSENNCYKAEYAETSFGEDHEAHCCPPQDNGFFALCQEKGSTKNIIAGHDHVNYASIEYQGIRLTYALKTGAAAYWEEGISGGTTITISSDGAASVAHHFVTVEY